MRHRWLVQTLTESALRRLVVVSSFASDLRSIVASWGGAPAMTPRWQRCNSLCWDAREEIVREHGGCRQASAPKQRAQKESPPAKPGGGILPRAHTSPPTSTQRVHSRPPEQKASANLGIKTYPTTKYSHCIHWKRRSGPAGPLGSGGPFSFDHIVNDCDRDLDISWCFLSSSEDNYFPCEKNGWGSWHINARASFPQEFPSGQAKVRFHVCNQGDMLKRQPDGSAVCASYVSD